MATAHENRTADLIYTVAEIARFLGIRDRQARHLIDTAVIPTFKLGSIICARRSVIEAMLAEQEAEAARERRIAAGRAIR